MPQTTDDTDGNMEKAETAKARPMEATTRKHGKKGVGAENGENISQHGQAMMET